MKKCIALILVFSLALACTLPAMASEKEFYVRVNGEVISKYYFTEDGSLMVAVREVTDVVKHQVAWDPETGVVSITDGVNALNLLPDSGEYYFNNEERYSDIPVCTVNNTTYVPAEVYPMSMGAHTRLDERPAYTWISIIQPVRFTESLDMETLVKYNIVSREDLAKDGEITVMEALEAVGRVCGASRKVKPETLRTWYYGKELADLDYLDDETKCFLTDLFAYGEVIKKEELAEMELDGALTRGQALMLLVRLVGNTGGCTGTKAELEYTEAYQVYDRAQERGLIYEADMTRAEEPVARGEFYELLLRSLYIERYIGGYALRLESYIDTLEKRSSRAAASVNTIVETPEDKKRPVQGSAIFNNDMSVTLGQPWRDAMDMTRVGVVLNSGEVDYFYGSNGLSRITAMQLLVMMSVYDFDDIRCLRASKGDEYFDIDISKLKIVHENNAPVPGVYDKSTKTVTLGNGESFKEMVYYIIHSYQHDYRDDSYNQKSRFVFRIFDDQTSVCLDSNGMNKYGTYIEEDMHIRSVRVEGNAGDGFTLYVSTLSEEAFAEAEPSK